MKRLASCFLAFLFLLSAAFFSSAQEFPKPVGFVNDFAGVLDSSQAGELNALLTALEENTTAEVAVVTINSTAPLDTKAYAVGLLENWGIGKKGKDNGLLILLALQERRIEVETGYGLEGILPDSKVGRILDDYVVSHLKAGDYGVGLVEGTKAFAQVIYDNRDEVFAGTAGPQPAQWTDSLAFLAVFLLPFIMFFVMFGVLVGLSVRKKYLLKCPKCGTVMKAAGSERVEKKDAFGKRVFNAVGYKCPKCGFETKKEFPERKALPAALILMGGGWRRGGGFGGGGWSGGGGFGGFGGGFSGGGGAGRGF
jgi:uncharacterized protein